MNREAWLTEVAKQCEPFFQGFTLKEYRLTCGWPSVNALSRKKQRVGECHGAKSSTSGIFELFISPVLDNPLEVAGTVCHELAHVAAGIDAAHGPRFVRVCKHVGLLKGKPTSVMPGDILNDELRKLIDKLGPYPHKKMTPVGKESKPPSDVKLECVDCGCKITMGKKWYGEVGAPPSCACGGEFDVK